MSQRAALFTLVAIIAAVYPFLIYFGLNEFGIRSIAVLLLIVLSLRVLLWQQFKKQEKVALILLIFVLCGLAAWLRSEAILRYYPVLMNLGFGTVFLISLRTKQPLIERIMRLVIKDLPKRAIGYMRGLTLAWGIVLIANAFISFYTACCLSLQQWTIYNGAIAYALFGTFALAELVYRHYYKKRHPPE